MPWSPHNTENPEPCPNASSFVQQVAFLSGNLTTQLANIPNARSLRFLYRGVSDSTHRLVPSALRTREEHPAAYDLLWRIYQNGRAPLDENELETELNQSRAELLIAKHFLRFAERAGLNLPPMPYSIRQELLTGHGNILNLATHGQQLLSTGLASCQWPHSDILPLLGLAQHYGLPTRLLDWSYSPFVAAYFAASGGLQRLKNGDPPDSTLTVWATSANTFVSYGQLDGFQELGAHSSLATYPARLISPPTADNPNLALQQGVFTVVIRAGQITPEDTTDRSALPERLEHFRDNTDNIAPHQQVPQFQQLRLPISEAPALLHSLQALGYSANRIFDGFNGAASAVKESALLGEILDQNSTPV